jgi:hypothetical protein
MTDDLQQWDRKKGEPDIWYQRFTRYRLLFPVRSVSLVFHQEFSARLDNTRKTDDPDGSWYKKAKDWRWQERADAWDTYLTAEEEEARKRILGSGLALAHRRIVLLNETLDGLLEMLKDEEKVWLKDIRTFGSGDDAQMSETIRFNDALYRETREYIKSIAEEVGDRVKKKEVHIKSMPPNVYIGFNPDQEDGIDDI